MTTIIVRDENGNSLGVFELTDDIGLPLELDSLFPVNVRWSDSGENVVVTATPLESEEA